MRNKYALFVGINRFRKPGHNLAGCVNDVKDMMGLLAIPANHCTVLLNQQAARANIIDGLAWLMAVTQPGDDALLHISSHGSQVVDQDGDEIDRLDEIVCPYDYDLCWENPLSDDVLRKAFEAKKRGAYLTVILDMCHAGSSTRDPEPPGSRLIKPRYLKPPVGMHIGQGLPLNRLGVKQLKGYGQTAEDMNHVLFAACQASQTAADAQFNGRPNGAWSWALVKTLRQTDGRITNHDLHRHASLALRMAGFSQKPCLEGRPELQERPFLGGF